MTFEQAQAYLLSIVNIDRKEYMTDANQCKVYLERLQFFLDILGNPEKKIPHYIHIAGTSGKGSVTTFLHHILDASGRNVGMLQSPHPTDIRERWTIKDTIMTEQEYIDIANTFKAALDTCARTSPYDMVSYSELNTAFGLYFFAQKGIEWCVLETACGGRYDSTNIVPNKDIAIITNIGLDHVAILGDTKEKIAYEKAGIIKPESAVFSMERLPSVRAVLDEEAALNDVDITYVEPAFTIDNINWEGTNFTYQDKQYHLQTYGEHQAYNAILAIEVARSLGVHEESIINGLAKATQPIRMERVAQHPIVILDGAHNEDKIDTTVQTMKRLITGTQKLHIVLGLSGDKKADELVAKLATLSPTTIACTRNTMNAFRKVAPPSRLAAAWHAVLPEAITEIFLAPADALEWSKKQASEDDIILVTGSVFLAGEIRGHLLDI